MTPDKFWEFLDRNIIFYGKRKYVGEISNTNKDLLYKIESMNFDDSCIALHQVAKEYNQIDQYPKELAQAIYFVIMREITKRVFSEDGKKKYLGKDEKIHKSIRLGISKKVFMTLKTGIEPSKQKEYEEKQKKVKAKKPNYMKQQERMGIEPYHDFFWAYFGEVGFRSRNNRGILDVLIRRILEVNDYPAIIDLSGECTILETLYFAKEEFIFCRDSNACILYNTLKTNYKKFCKALKAELESWDEFDRQEAINHVKSFRAELEKEATKKKEISKDYNEIRDLASGNYRYVFTTYPYEKESTVDNNKTKIAVKYFLWKLCEDDTLFEYNIFTIAEYLHERIKNVGVIYDSAKELVNWLEADIPEDKKEAEKIKDVAFLPMVVNGVTKPRRIKSTYFEEQKKTKDRHKLPDGKYSYTDGRLKKGVIFLDWTVNKNYEDRQLILDLVQVLGCKWIIVCETKEDILKEELGDSKIREIYLKDTPLKEWNKRLKNSYNKKILTNIEVKSDIFCNHSILYEYEIKACNQGCAEYKKAEEIDNWEHMDEDERQSICDDIIYILEIRDEKYV